MLYLILKVIFKIALRVFFRKIEVRNQHLIPVTGPLLIAANHPNTFMDPIAIAAVVKPEVFFIAKSTVFSSPLNKWLLHQMNLIPVYRREDGASPTTGNSNAFRKCFEILKQCGTLLIFPEGNSFNERRLRPLKTGAARMALETEANAAFKAGVQILPIGLNYSDPTRFRSNLFINVGQPIMLADYAAAYAHDTFKTAQDLTERLRTCLEELLVITNTPEEDELLQQVEAIYRNNLVTALNLTNQQQDKFILTKGIADSIRYFNIQEPERVRNIQEKVNCYYQELEKLGLQDKYLDSDKKIQSPTTTFIFSALYLSLGFPLYIGGVLTHYIPYWLPAKLADKLTDEQEFRAPVMMTAGIFTFSIFYALEIGGVYWWSDSGWVTLFFALLLPVSGFFALHYHYRLKLAFGYLQRYFLFYRRKDLIDNILQQRIAIVQKLEEAKNLYIQYTTATKE